MVLCAGIVGAFAVLTSRWLFLFVGVGGCGGAECCCECCGVFVRRVCLCAGIDGAIAVLTSRWLSALVCVSVCVCVDRKSVVWGKSVDLGGRRISKKKIVSEQRAEGW